jgi:hypothetical protein
VRHAAYVRHGGLDDLDDLGAQALRFFPCLQIRLARGMLDVLVALTSVTIPRCSMTRAGYLISIQDVRNEFAWLNYPRSSPKWVQEDVLAVARAASGNGLGSRSATVKNNPGTYLVRNPCSMRLALPR